MAIGDVVGRADLIGVPLRRAPVEGLALGDHVAHGPHGLFDRRVRVRSVTEHEVDEVEAEALERAVDRLGEVLAIEGEAHVGDVEESPVELRGDDVLVPLPAQLPERVTHDALGLTGGVRLGVVEEVDARVLGGAETLGRLVGRFDLIGVGERDPTAEGEQAHLETGSAETSILHVSHGFSL